MPFGPQYLVVSSALAELVKMASLFFSLARSCMAIARDEMPMSKIAPTPLSYHWRASVNPVSTLFNWSPTSSSMGRFSTLPPKSSMAICAASTDPGPDMPFTGPDMSFMMAILKGPPACAQAPDMPTARLAASSTPQSAVRRSGLRRLSVV